MQLLYNDLSPMENHHLAAAFGIMRQPGNNFMDHLPRKVSCRRAAGAGAGTTNGQPEGREVRGMVFAAHLPARSAAGGMPVSQPGGCAAMYGTNLSVGCRPPLVSLSHFSVGFHPPLVFLSHCSV